MLLFASLFERSLRFKRLNVELSRDSVRLAGFPDNCELLRSSSYLYLQTYTGGLVVLAYKQTAAHICVKLFNLQNVSEKVLRIYFLDQNVYINSIRYIS